MYQNFNQISEDLGSFDKMLCHKVIDHPLISAIEFNFCIRKDHGAPSSIIVKPQEHGGDEVARIMKSACDALNKIPDAIDIRPSELKSGSDWKYRDINGDVIDFGDGNKPYPNYRGRHNNCGGDPTIDTISAENAVPVLSKFIFGLAESNAISNDEAVSAFQDLFSQIKKTHAELGLPAVSTRRDADGHIAQRSSVSKVPDIL